MYTILNITLYIVSFLNVKVKGDKCYNIKSRGGDNVKFVLFLQLLVLVIFIFSMYILPSNAYFISVLSIFIIVNTAGLSYYVFRIWISNIGNSRRLLRTSYSLVLTVVLIGMLYLIINVFKLWVERYPQDTLMLFINTLLIISTFLLVSFGIAYLTMKKELERQIIENERLKQSQLVLKLESLKSKLNPHFLFNSIAVAISMIDLGEDKEKLKSYLSNVTDLLRLSIDAPEVWSVKEELELASKYLNVQKERFEGLNFEIYISEHYLNRRIPALILQPILENAIVHGISKSKHGGMVTISCQGDNEKEIIIEVKDNGVGAENIQKGTGLTIVEERLKLFSKDSRLEYSSKVNEGTCVRIHVVYL